MFEFIFGAFLVANHVDRERMMAQGQIPRWSMRHPLLAMLGWMVIIVGVLLGWFAIWAYISGWVAAAILVGLVLWLMVRSYQSAEARYGTSQPPKKTRAELMAEHRALIERNRADDAAKRAAGESTRSWVDVIGLTAVGVMLLMLLFLLGFLAWEAATT